VRGEAFWKRYFKGRPRAGRPVFTFSGYAYREMEFDLAPASGAVGLATARLLQRMGKTVAIYAKALPPFPRRDGIVLGGTVVRGDWSLQPDLEAKQRIVAAHQRLFRGP